VEFDQLVVVQESGLHATGDEVCDSLVPHMPLLDLRVGRPVLPGWTTKNKNDNIP